MTVTVAQLAGDRDAPAHADCAEQLLAILIEVCAATAEVDPDRLSSATPAGRVVLALAGLARRATGQLGGVIGGSLGVAPGIVVVRDLAVTTRALGRTVAVCSGGCDPDLVAQARALHAALLTVLTRVG